MSARSCCSPRSLCNWQGLKHGNSALARPCVETSKYTAMSKPFLDKKATDQLNLSVLRRVDPDTEQVRRVPGVWFSDHNLVSSCTTFGARRCWRQRVTSLCMTLTKAKKPGLGLCYVCRQSPCIPLPSLQCTEFLPMQTRKDVEGSLFLLKRQTQPRFKIIILNKKSQGKHNSEAAAC